MDCLSNLFLKLEPWLVWKGVESWNSLLISKTSVLVLYETSDWWKSRVDTKEEKKLTWGVASGCLRRQNLRLLTLNSLSNLTRAP
jgi:hypothetical protein